MAEENKAMELHGEESEKKKYISDVLDIDKLIEEYGNKIMLIAGVGSGKSTWVKDVLTQKGHVLFITSRRAKVDEDIAHSCFTSFVREQDGQRENLITNAIADPDAKNLEGIKENLEDIFGKDGLGQSDFFKGKTDKELENFWDYLQDNNYNPKQMNWNEETTKKNFEAAQEAKKKTPEESATFASKFKNAAEDTATDIDTVTDNFQSDMKNIQSAMESVTNGTFQNSDMADLIQQFPELSNASGDLKDNLQNLAMNKGAEAIGKIRDSVKDVTDPKQLAQADKYVQSIMDTMDSQSRIIILLRLHYIEIRLTIYRKNLVQKRL